MDLFILKTNVEKFTSTYEKTLHMIFNCVPVVWVPRVSMDVWMPELCRPTADMKTSADIQVETAICIVIRSARTALTGKRRGYCFYHCACDRSCSISLKHFTPTHSAVSELIQTSFLLEVVCDKAWQYPRIYSSLDCYTSTYWSSRFLGTRHRAIHGSWFRQRRCPSDRDAISTSDGTQDNEPWSQICWSPS